jgi:hypothetical protein
VRQAQDWPWASLSERLQPSQSIQLVNAPFLSTRAWADYVNTPRPGDDAAHNLLAGVSRLDDLAKAPSRFA